MQKRSKKDRLCDMLSSIANMMETDMKTEDIDEDGEKTLHYKFEVRMMMWRYYNQIRQAVKMVQD